MQHVIVWVGRTVVHGEGWYGEAAGRIVIQDMLPRGVESISCGPRMMEEKIIYGAGAAPKGGYMDGTGRGKPLARSGTYW